MKQVASELRSKIDTLVIIGIGGSYLGMRAADEMIRGLKHKDKVEVVYAGHTMSSTYTAQLVEYLKDKNFGICVISKSGTTTEPGVAFRILEQELVNKVGVEKSRELIVAVTDKQKRCIKKIS